MISAKFAWPVAAALVIALVPTVTNVYRQPAPLQAGALEAELPTEDAGPGRRDASWTSQHFGADDFVSRRLANGIELFAARSYDAKRLFHFPELAVDYGRSVTQRRIVDLDTPAGAVPTRRLEFRTSHGLNLSFYVLLYGDRPVREPMRFLLGTLPQLFIGRREAMTLVYVQSAADPEDPAAVEADLKSTLATMCAELMR